ADLALHPDSRLSQLTNPLTTVDVFTAAEQGDDFATELLERLAGWLGLGIANIVSLVNPEVVILGGGMGSQCARLLPSIRDVVRRWAQPISAGAVQLKVSSLGARAGLLVSAYAARLRVREAKEKS